MWGTNVILECKTICCIEPNVHIHLPTPAISLAGHPSHNCLAVSVAELSAAGTAVGIASLGITAVQGLVRYYNLWKDCDVNVGSTLDSLSGLEKNLGLIKGFLDDGNGRQRPVSRLLLLKLSNLGVYSTYD